MNNIYIIGSGQIPEKHLTIEAIDKIKQSGKTLIASGNSENIIKAIPFDFNYEDISYLYQDGDLDENNYKRIIDKVITESLLHNHLSITTAGHPLVGVSWWERLKKNPKLKSNLHYVEGISSLTSILTDLEIDPLENGTISVDSNRLLIFNQDINPEFNLIIFNFCSTGTRKTFISQPYRENEIGYLQRHLLKFYNPNHIVYMVSSEHSGVTMKNIICTEINKLETLLKDIKFYSSLFIPASNPNKCDKIFLKKILDI